MARVYLGLGSNLGDRASHIWEATHELGSLLGVRELRLSPVYESEPVGPVDQPWFLNAVVAASTIILPLDLLDACQAIERRMGRVTGETWGPRLIDIDLLLYSGLRLQTERLVLPHPELWNRRFALAPLLDVAVSGRLRERIANRLAALPDRPRVLPTIQGLRGPPRV